MAEVDKKVVNVENLDSLKEKLMAVTNEIDNIKVTFEKSTEELARVQSVTPLC